MDFVEKQVQSWSDFTEFVSERSGEWVYRGQTQDYKDWPLSPSLERLLRAWDVDLKEAPAVEQKLIREFRRQYHQEDQHLIDKDTLYCLAVMQHHGAPTRLLDWTYSPFVAAKFALETGSLGAVVWCINTAWCLEEAKRLVGEDAINARNHDSTRDDTSFVPLYMPTEGSSRHSFVFAENAVKKTRRLIVQKGVFMCPGDVAAPFMENLREMRGYDKPENVIKLRFSMDRREVARFVLVLRSMNVDSAVLFPGLDGFARSLHEQLPLILDFARRGIGGPGYKTGSTI